MTQIIRVIVPAFTGLAFAVPLAVYAYLGASMRLNGDDYCYSMLLTQYGFWATQLTSYIGATVVAGNRYALTFFSSLSTLPGRGSMVYCRDWLSRCGWEGLIWPCAG